MGRMARKRTERHLKLSRDLATELNPASSVANTRVRTPMHLNAHQDAGTVISAVRT